MKDVLFVVVGIEPALGDDFCCSGLFVCFVFVFCFVCSYPRILSSFVRLSVLGFHTVLRSSYAE